MQGWMFCRGEVELTGAAAYQSEKVPLHVEKIHWPPRHAPLSRLGITHRDGSQHARLIHLAVTSLVTKHQARLEQTHP